MKQKPEIKDIAKNATAKLAKRKSEPKAAAKKPTTSARPTGRPSGYSKEIAERICDKISTTTKSLRRICAEDETLPSSETVRRWLYKDEGGFRALYAHAKEQQMEMQEEELLEIADDGTNDTYVDEEGKPRVDTDVIQRSRLRVDTRKWLMSKLAPKKYGDKVDVNHGGQTDNPVQMLYQQITGTPFKPK